MNFWNIKAPVYSLFRKVPVIRGIFLKEQQQLERLIKQIERVPDKSLDVGTGTGSTLNSLRGCKQLICMDYSFRMIQRFKSKYSSFQVLQADLMHLPFKRYHFQFISVIGVSEYIEKKEAMLKSLKCCLESDGYLLITMAPPHFFNRLRNIMGNRLYLINAKAWDKMVNQSGFLIVKQMDSLLQRQYLLQSK